MDPDSWFVCVKLFLVCEVNYAMGYVCIDCQGKHFDHIQAILRERGQIDNSFHLPNICMGRCFHSPMYILLLWCSPFP